MLNVSIVFAIIIAAGYAAIMFFRFHAKKMAIAFGSISILFGIWLLVASLTTPPCVAVTYYDIIKRQSPNGINYLVTVVNNDGEKKIVNLNQSGITVPSEGNYQVARIVYSNSVLGLLFDYNNIKYRVVAKK